MKTMKQRIYFILINIFIISSCAAQNRTNLSGQNDSIIIKSDSLETFHIIEKEPIRADGILEFDMIPLNSHGHIGAVLRYQSPDSWMYLGCDISSDLFGRAVWYITTPEGTTAFAKDINKPFTNIKRRIKIKYLKDIITLWIEGEEVICKALPTSVPYNSPGKIGFRAWDGGAMKIENVHYTPCYSMEVTNIPVENIRIASSEMDVFLDSSFPRILKYVWHENAAKLYGQHEAYNYITINGNNYQPTVQVGTISNNSVDYEIDIPELDIRINMKYVIEGNSLTMQVTSIKEEGDIKVKTIGFPKNSLVSVKNSQANGTLSTSELVYDFTAKDNFRSGPVHKDFFYQLKDKKVDKSYVSAGIVILNTDKLAATIDNNVIRNLRQFRYQTQELDGTKITGIWNNDWIYRGLDNKITELPWAKILIAPDMNADNVVDWQDGAIALRQIIPEFDGAEKLRKSFFHLDKTSGSRTNYTFLRWLDFLKKMNLYTDGFGQIFQIKGYQSEGHDSAHPDYGNNFNMRAGGLKDLRTLFKGAKQYNTDICLHINHSESYPEAKSFNPEIVSDIPAWEWWDQSYFIKRKPDILNGTFKGRLKQLHDSIPELKFVYLDTYREERWIADYTAKLFKEMNWAIYTEDSYALDRFASWVHYTPEGKSKISRFVHHQNKDAYKADSLLLGGYESRNYRVSDVTGLMYNFMTNQLPYRYLMHFPIMKWTDKEAVFTSNVKSMVVKGQTVITKDNKVIFRGRDIFIPWDPEEETKIYCYNTSGIKNIWELPDSWMEQPEVELYELTDLGRKFVKSVSVNAGRVTLDLKNKTPYVLYKQKVKPVDDVEWGEGSLVKDMGFDSKGFIVWKRGQKSVNQDVITIKTSKKGNAYLSIEGKNDSEFYVSQKITGLEKGKTYAASVWVEVANGRKATIGVVDYGGLEVSNYSKLRGVKNTVSSQKEGNYQRIRVLFTMSKNETEATLFLKATSGEEGNFVRFDDVRIVPFLGNTSTEHLFYEDFENVDEGIYPFIQGNSSVRAHLSENHKNYTNDVISGNFSLKISSSNPNGLMIHSLPSNLRFQPNTKYTVSFKYKVDQYDKYRVVIKSLKGDDESMVVNKFLNESGDFKYSFTTGSEQDYSIFFYKYGKKAESDLVIDNLRLKTTF